MAGLPGSKWYLTVSASYPSSPKAKAVPSTPHSYLTNICPTLCGHDNTILHRT